MRDRKQHRRRRRRLFLLPFTLSLLLCLSFNIGHPQGGQKEAVQKNPVTIAVLYPSIGTLKDLVTLRRERLIAIADLAIVGVYHVREKTDYGKAEEFARQNGLDWIVFHPISAPLSGEVVYQENACTLEFREIFDRVDGVVFFGGPDIPPRLYGEATSLLTEITDPHRHFLELSFVFHLLGGFQDESFVPFLRRRPEFPIFGICLGCQSLAVGTGGALTQDIASGIYGAKTFEDVIALGKENWHTSPHFRLFPREDLFRYALHRIRIEKASLITRKIRFSAQKTPLILSAHHQQVKKMGKGFRAIATSLDGRIVEAVEHADFPNVLGVQFHPEMSSLYDREYRVVLTPEESEAVSLRSVLESDAPSWEFHRKLWSWVSRAWADAHRARTPSR